MRVGVIGLGYVGLPLALEFCRGGLNVVGIDVDAEKVARIAQGETIVLDVGSDALRESLEKGLLLVTTDFSVLRDVDAVCVCVPTPLTKTMDPDISYIVAAVDEVAKYLHSGMLVVLESTTYPGTTDELVLPRLEETGLKAGVDFFLAFSPERVDPGNPTWHTRNTPKIIGGVTPACTKRAQALYSHAVETLVPVSSPSAAEMVKLLENTYRAINIGLVNELAIMCRHLNVDVWEVVEAAKTKPFGFMAFYPGPGLGGHCIPVDPLYLSWKMKTMQYTARFIELATAINSSMPEYVVTQIADALNDARKSVNGSKILVMGVAYKQDVNDTRESPAIDIIGLLQKKGADVSYADPYVPELERGGKPMKSVSNAASYAEYDCVVVCTAHKSFDYDRLVREARLVYDARNATKDHAPAPTCTVVKL
ncbi:MAG: nucleotide sugar dehydrogenase [Candidatus Hydrogenedentes bacterium]|nr:nucleotide sugar dehydrogenase [Candidatus Hydrogenedentota bacterium]